MSNESNNTSVIDANCGDNLANGTSLGKITLLSETTKNPITLIGERAGICWGADVSDPAKNYKRGLDCLANNHGRTFEYVNVEMVIDGYSARVIREWYTHIGGSPTRLQASTRYINYAKHDFDFVTPNSINSNPEAKVIYDSVMKAIADGERKLEEEMNIPREDAAMLFPLGMCTKIVDRRNLRNLIDMSRQRLCTRAYSEYRHLMADIIKALRDYSDEWNYIIDNYFGPKCNFLGYCPETKGCGRFPTKE